MYDGSQNTVTKAKTRPSYRNLLVLTYDGLKQRDSTEESTHLWEMFYRFVLASYISREMWGMEEENEREKDKMS